MRIKIHTPLGDNPFSGCAARCAEGLCPSGSVDEFRGYAPTLGRSPGLIRVHQRWGVAATAHQAA
jgi:hypothetical protein